MMPAPAYSGASGNLVAVIGTAGSKELVLQKGARLEVKLELPLTLACGSAN